MSVLSDWTGKLTARRALQDRAKRSVAFWARRAGSLHGKAMLKAARARLALRDQQVAEAERVVQRHQVVDTVSNQGIAFIAGFEGFRSAPYRDAVGVWTIGYGETQGVGPNTRPWTRDHALRQLRQRVNRDYLAPVLATAATIRLTLTQNQADALASLIYNVGPAPWAPRSAPRTTGRSPTRSSSTTRPAAARCPASPAAGAPNARSTSSEGSPAVNTTVVKVRKLISKNKAIAAGVTTLSGAVGTAAVSAIVTGSIDPTEIRTAAGGLVLALVTYGATYLTSAGTAEVEQ
jgi:hypothetical protein